MKNSKQCLKDMIISRMEDTQLLMLYRLVTNDRLSQPAGNKPQINKENV